MHKRGLKELSPWFVLPKDIRRLIFKKFLTKFDLHVFKHAFLPKYKIPFKVRSYALKNGHVELLKSITIKPDKAWVSRIIRESFENFDGPVLKDILLWLLNSRYVPPNNVLVCCEFVEKGDFEGLEWAIDNGFQCNERVTTRAAFVRDLGMVEWLMEAGYGILECALHDYIKNLMFDDFCKLIELGCPWGETTLCHIRAEGWDEALEFLQQKR